MALSSEARVGAVYCAAPLTGVWRMVAEGTAGPGDTGVSEAGASAEALSV